MKNNADYYVGALVAAELDRQSRLATNQESSLQTTFSLLNAHGSAVDATRFEAFLRQSTTDDIAGFANRFTRTTERPTMWSETDHDTAFGPTPAGFGYVLAPADTYRVSEPYRNRTLGKSESITLVPGETLIFNATVSNAGGRAGNYDAVFRLNSEVEDRQQGQLGLSEQATVSFEQQFDEPGEYTIAVGDEMVPVTVREPVTASVTAFSANRTIIETGQSVALMVSISNDQSVPATLSVPITRDGNAVTSNVVQLDTGEQQSVTAVQRLDRPGKYVFGLGESSTSTVIVTVEQSPLLTTPTIAVGLILLLALVGGVLYCRYRP